MAAAGSPLRFGVFEVDVCAGELRKGGVRLKLQEQPFQILVMLLEKPGKVVTREELQQRLWPDGTFVDFERGLNAAIRRLRQALGDSAENPRFVETLPRHGYRFAAPVSRLEGTQVARARRSWHAAVALGALLPLLAVMVWLLVKDGYPRSRPQPERAISSLAVLPLQNLTGDPEQDYLADGLTDAFITELARLVPFRVVSRTSAMTYRNSDKPLPQIARELGVDGIVEGSVTSGGQRIRVTVQLVDAVHDRHLWAESFDRELGDILSLQEDVARAVAAELGLRMVRRERPARKFDPEANWLFVRGRYFYSRWPEGLEDAIDHFERAVARDPRFARARGMLAMGHLDLAFGGPSQPAVERARREAQLAIEVDDLVAEGWAVQGAAKMLGDWDWIGAEKDLRRAVALDPASSEIRIWYSNLLTAEGRFDEAVSEARRAREGDPASLFAHQNMAWTLSKAHRFDEAVLEYRRELELEPRYGLGRRGLAWVYTHQRRVAEALAEYEAAGVGPNDPFRGYLYGVSGQRAKALAVARGLERQRREGYVTPYYIAVPYAGLGDTERALYWIGKSIEERSAIVFLIKVDPWLDVLRNEPHFQDYLHQIGFDGASHAAR